MWPDPIKAPVRRLAPKLGASELSAFKGRAAVLATPPLSAAGRLRK
jgi:hypothetical protein